MEVAFWLVPFAGALGAIARLLCDYYVSARGILAANLAGSFLAGIATAILAIGPLHVRSLLGEDASVLAAAMVVILGFTTALTTFSTVSVSAAKLAGDRQIGAVCRLWATHLGGGLVAAVLGGILGWGLMHLSGFSP